MDSNPRAYDRAWTRYRRLRLHVLVAFACFGLSVFVVVLADLPSRIGSDSLALVVGSWLYCAIASQRLGRFHCPRCDKRFGLSWRSWNAWLPSNVDIAG